MKTLLKLLAVIVALIVYIAFFGFPLHAQKSNTFQVDQQPGNTVADKTAAAQSHCRADIPCVLIFDPILAAFTAGSMPAQGANEIWQDYRTPNKQIPSSAAGSVNGLDITPKSVNGLQMAEQFTGADACAKIAAAITALPSGGGTVDARSFTGDQTCASSIVLGSTTKPVTLLLGNSRLIISTSPAITIHNGSKVLGTSQKASFINYQAAAVGVLFPGSQGVLSKVTLQAAATNAGDAILIQGVSPVSAEHNEVSFVTFSGPNNHAGSRCIELQANTNPNGLASFNTLTDLTLNDCETSIEFSSSSTQGPTDNNIARFSIGSTSGTAGTGIKVSHSTGDLNNLSDGFIAGKVTGIDIGSGSSFNVCARCRFESNTTNINDNGTGTMFLALSLDANTVTGTDATRVVSGRGNVAFTQSFL
jgi:hypothetical protein